jgi:hypothetical protein
MRMSRFLFAGVIFSIAIGAALGQSVSSPSVPPTLAFVRKIDPAKGQIVIVRIALYREQVPFTEKVNLNGQLVDVTRVVERDVHRAVDIVYDVSVSRVITREGKQLPLDQVFKHVKAGAPIAISEDFNTPAPRFLRALSAETFVLIPPPPIQPQPK